MHSLCGIDRLLGNFLRLIGGNGALGRMRKPGERPILKPAEIRPNRSSTHEMAATSGVISASNVNASAYP